MFSGAGRWGTDFTYQSQRSRRKRVNIRCGDLDSVMTLEARGEIGGSGRIIRELC